MIRPVQPGDLSALQMIARTAFRGTRFFNDRHFPRPRVEELYSTWMTLDARGRAQAVWVAVSAADQPLGCISCHLDPARHSGLIGLVCVDPAAQGKGIGKRLVQAAIDWFCAEGASTISVVTQGANLAAQRLYQQCGFLSRDTRLWYHKWYPAREPRTDEQ